MKTINLFVACPENSDDLNALKVEINKLCHKLNEEYAEKKMQEEVNIIPVTYMNPERRKEVCEEIIKYRADIVLFLFDDAPDNCLMDELRITVEHSNKFHKPEPLVFIKTGKKKKDDDSKEKLREDINEILAKGGWLYELFTDKHDLWQKIRYKIEQYFHSYDIIRNIQELSKIRHYLKSYVLIPFIIGIIGVTIWLSFSLYKAESKRLLIVGGGSARAFFEDSVFHEKGSLSTKFWLYAPLPSGDAYRMMAEEIINISNSDYKSHPYFPIVISAGKAKGDSVFRRTISPKTFLNKGVVIGMYVGEDYLVAYNGNHAIDDSLIGAESTIKASTLNKIIAQQDSLLRIKDTSNQIHIFTTNNNSGTLNSFRDNGCYNIVSYTTICDSLKYGRVFSDIDRLSKQTSYHKWIALGSNNYRPKDSIDVVPLVVHNNDGNPITKPVYFYFMLYKDKDNSTYILPKATKKFLKSMNMRPSLIDSIQYNKGLKIDSTTVLYDNIYYYKNQKNKK